MNQYAQIYTLGELLASHAFKGNKSKLSRVLGINRRTVNEYATDKDNRRHAVFILIGEYIFMTVPTNRKGKE